MKLISLWALLSTVLSFAKLSLLYTKIIGALKQWSCWFCDTCSSHGSWMIVIPKWNFQTRPLNCTAGLYFQLFLGYFYLSLLQTKWAYHLFPNSPFNFPHDQPHLQFFRWPGQPLELSGSLSFISSSPHHLWTYTFISIAIIILHFSWFLESVPSYIWVSVNVLRHYFILAIFFSEFSSDLLCVMNQVQILYLGIPRLSFSL